MLRNKMDPFLKLGAGDELTKTHMLAEAERDMALRRIYLPVGIEHVRAFESGRITARNIEVEEQHRARRDRDIAIDDLLGGEPERGAGIEHAQCFFDHPAAIFRIVGAAFVYIAVLHHQMHHVREHVFRRVIPGHEQEDQQIGKLPVGNTVFLRRLDQQIEQIVFRIGARIRTGAPREDHARTRQDG